VRAFLSLPQILELNSYAKPQETEVGSQETEEKPALLASDSLLLTSDS
jgi:hypothetical protein